MYQRDLTTEQSHVHRICTNTGSSHGEGHLMENIGHPSLTGSLGTRLWIWALWSDRTCNREDEASFELHGIRRRKGMVSNCTINDWLVVRTIYVYGYIYYTSHEVMTLTHEE
jgi:hypothetical protein